MKKSLLLSIVASTMIMAGGDIAPAPVVVEEEVFPQWDFSGQAVLYYQTVDGYGAGDLFAQESSLANAGIQLNALGKFNYGLSAGAQLTGLGTLGLENDVVSKTMQMPGVAEDGLTGGAITNIWLGWANDSTSFKYGRQDLPKSLSPFAWSEHWNVFQNSYEAALLVNTSLADTILVGAWVNKANHNGVYLGSNLSAFDSVNDEGDGIWMATVQNKSIAGLTLTGSWYYAADMLADENGQTNDLNILWGDVAYANADLPVTFGLQGGAINSDTFLNDTTAFGAKVGGKFNQFTVSAAYSSVDDGDAGVFNVGGVKTPLYTQMILNQGFIKSDNDTFLIKATMKALGGKFIAQYGATTMNDRLINEVTGHYGDRDYGEFDFIYKTKVWNDSIVLLAAYVNQTQDELVVATENGSNVLFEDSNNVIRFWARYNF